MNVCGVIQHVGRSDDMPEGGFGGWDARCGRKVIDKRGQKERLGSELLNLRAIGGIVLRASKREGSKGNGGQVEHVPESTKMAVLVEGGEGICHWQASGTLSTISSFIDAVARSNKPA